MNKFSKDKRDKLLLICIGVVAAVSVLYFFVLADMKDELATLTAKTKSLRDKIDKSERILQRQADFQANLEAIRGALSVRETQMPRPGQDHVWFLNIMEARRGKYNLDINDIRNPEAVDPGVLPKFPYKGVAFTVTVVGTYTDFGRFLADFENDYPYMRVQLVNILPDAPITPPGVTQAVDDGGKLRFNFRVISLIKTQT